MAYEDTMASLGCNVKRETRDKIKARAKAKDVSMNSYLKLLVYKDLGLADDAPERGLALSAWLEGK